MTTQPLIPFNRPHFCGGESAYIQEAIQNNWQISGEGPFTKRCHALLEEILGVKKALLTTSCTDALEMSALLLRLTPGDEVIVPSFTFVSTPNAYVLHGARPVFIDSHPDTLNLDESLLEEKLTAKTRAVAVVHYGGVACAMDEINALCGPRGVSVIEDNAHGLFATYKGRSLGTLGAMATLSFHETKNFTCGEGGALLINDASLIERAEIIREKGTNRSRFFKGLVDKYTWVDVGSSFLPSDLLAAFLLAQLEQREHIQATRRRIWETYNEALAPWAEKHGFRLPVIPPDREQAYHLFYLIAPTAGARDALMAHLKSQNVNAVFHYLPLHLSDMGRKFGGRPGDCPVAEDLSARLLRLPFFNDLTPDDQDRVITAVQSFAT